MPINRPLRGLVPRKLFWILFFSFPASVFSSTAPRHAIEGVPFISQRRNWCGPACLAMAARYYGVGVSQEKIADDIYQRRLRGSVNLDLLLAARRIGFRAHAAEGDMDQLKTRLRNNTPVIALVGAGRAGAFHYLLVYGYDDDKEVVIVHSGRDAAREINYRDFSSSWEASRNWMLVVERKEEWP